MKKQNEVILGKKMGAEEDVLFKGNSRKLNTLLLGATGHGKEAFVIHPLLKQDMANKEMNITVFDPIGTTAETAYALAKSNRRNVLYFNPLFKDMKFNPLKGNEEDAIWNMEEMIRAQFNGQPQFFISMYELVIRYTIKMLNALHGNNIIMKDVNDFLWNQDRRGFKSLMNYRRMKNHDDFIVTFLTDYLDNNSKTYEHCAGLRMLFLNITTSKIGYIFDTKEEGDFIELDFSSNYDNYDVLIINTQSRQIGMDIGRALNSLISTSYKNAIMAGTCKKEQHLYIKELFYYLRNFEPLLSLSQQLGLSILAETQNISILNLYVREYVTNNLFTQFQNFIILPGVSMEDVSKIQQFILPAKEADSIRFLSNGEMYYYLLDEEEDGFRIKGKAKGIPLEDSEQQFLDKRMKRYQKEFQKRY